jgi:hypothetical protein
MADRSKFGYIFGRGIPTYLLDRVDNHSIISSEANITMEKETISSSTSHIVDCSTSFSMSSLGGASNFENTHLINTVDKQVQEVSMSSNISLMSIISSIPLFLTKDENRNTSLLSSNNYDSNSTNGPETMFPAYTRLFPESQDELEQAQKLNDPSNGLFNIVKKK